MGNTDRRTHSELHSTSFCVPVLSHSTPEKRERAMIHDIDAFEVRHSEKSGYGMVAGRDLFQRTIVLREKPIAILRASVLQEAVADLWPELTELRKEWHEKRSWPEEVHAPPVVIQRFAEKVFSTCTAKDQLRWLSLADAFAKTEHAKSAGGVARTNSVTDVDTGDCYLFEHLSRANHSCSPNMQFRLPAFACDGGAVTLSMRSDAPRGSALTISYIAPDDLERSTAERRALLWEKFNFVCECERCGPAHDDSWMASAPGGAQPEAAQSAEVVEAADVADTALNTKTHDTRAVLDAASTAVSAHLQACAALLGAASSPPPAPLLVTVRACAEALKATEGARLALSI